MPLPAGWEWTTVGDIAEVFRGASPRPKGDPRYFGGTIPWITIRDITRQPGKHLFETKEGVTQAGACLSRRLPPGSLILSNSGTVCVPKILTVEGCIHDGFVAFDGLADRIDLNFAYWWFEYVRPDLIQENRQGITQVNLNTEIVREIHFPFAPRAEQTRIADALDELLSDLDAGVAALEQARAKLDLYRAAVLKAAVDGSLTAEWREQNPDVEPASELLASTLAERRCRWEEQQLRAYEKRGQMPPKNWKTKYTEPAGPDTASLPTLPSGWRWATTEQLAWAASYGTSEKCHETDSGLAILRIPNIVGGRLDLRSLKYTSAESRHELVDVGDFLIVRTNGSKGLIGRGAIIRSKPDRPLGFASYLIRLRLVPTPALLEWIGRFWGSSHTRSWIEKHAATSAGQYNISLGVLANLPVPIPPPQEQHAINEALAEQMSVAEHIQSDLDAKLASAQTLRQSILRHAFTGQLVPQDPSDEPASELLKRIAAEREARAREAAAAKRASAPRRKAAGTSR